MKKLIIISGCLIGLFSFGVVHSQQPHSQQFIDYQIGAAGVSIQSTANTIYISPLQEGIVEVQYNDTFNLSDAIILKKTITPFDVTETADAIILNTTMIQCNYDKALGTLSFIHAADTVMQLPYAMTNTFQFRLKPKEQITGGGSRALPMNRRGYHLNLRNEPHYGYGYGQENLNFSVPFFISSRNFGVFFNNGSAGYADIGKSNPDILELSGSYAPSHYVMVFGDNTTEVVQGFYRLTGFQPLPPQWALGQFISRFGYKNQQAVYDISNRFKDEAIPSDAVIIDLYWFKGSDTLWNMGNLNWHADFPQPTLMLDSLKANHHKTILITEPFVLKSSHNFHEADSLGILAKDATGNTGIIENFYFGETGLIDVFNPQAKAWFWSKYQSQVERGVDGWWGDLGEPEKHPDFLIHQPGPAHQVTNLYGHEWSKMLFTAYAKHYPNTRLFHLNRSGFAGSQRYAGYPWSGDVGRNWSGLKAQISIMVGMNMCGMPYMHSDLGGFSLTDEPQDAELYIRWLQMGVFNPIFRPHAGDPYPSELVFWPDSVKQILKPYVALRYRMLPYNYTLAYQQAVAGVPLVQPFYNLNNDTAFISEEFYYWGKNILVAPVTRKGKEQLTISLPKGNWYSPASGEMLKGDQLATVHFTLEQQPVFIRAGSIIPTIPEIEHTEQYSTRELIYHIYLDSKDFTTSYTLFNDDGISAQSITSGAYELITLSLEQKAQTIEIFLSKQGDYICQPEERDITLVFHTANSQVSVSNNSTAKKIAYQKSVHAFLPFCKEATANQVFKFTWNNQDMKQVFSIK